MIMPVLNSTFSPKERVGYKVFDDTPNLIFYI